MASAAPDVASAVRPRVTWSDLPTEVVLEIVANADFDFALLRNLQLVDRRSHRLVRAYERSLCRGYAAGQLRAIIPRFPDIVAPGCAKCQRIDCTSGLSFRLLAEIQRRSDAVTTLVHRAFRLAPVCCCLCGWYRVFEAGMLLLYRLQERLDYDDKVSFIASMPLQALAAVFIALTQSLRAAQRGGIGLVHQDSQPQDPSARSDVHLVFEDLVLQIGPGFVLDILNHDEEAELVLRTQYDSLDEAQLHGPGDTPPRKSLISHLKRSYATQAGCRIAEVASKAMALANFRPLRDLNDDSLLQLVCFDEKRNE